MAVEVEGIVEAQLPAALYTVRLDGSERRVTAHLAAGTERNFIRLLPGDRVKVRLASQDLGRGAIVAKVR